VLGEAPVRIVVVPRTASFLSEFFELRTTVVLPHAHELNESRQHNATRSLCVVPCNLKS
jgi:hypothetical protein